MKAKWEDSSPDMLIIILKNHTLELYVINVCWFSPMLSMTWIVHLDNLHVVSTFDHHARV